MWSESDLSGGTSTIWLRRRGTDSAATYDGRSICAVLLLSLSLSLAGVRRREAEAGERGRGGNEAAGS